MTKFNYQNKITSKHLERKAIVYIRQSTEKQVSENKESQKLQYSLTDQAKEFGFNQIEVIDIDLGHSASIGSKRRKGFDQLISSVALGEVGMILSREVSRLSRTDKDWCQLLEVCQVFGTLIGDADQVYDLNSMNDQLLLGIKGTMSAVELNILKMRMIEGMNEKAQRGELLRILPPGYVKDSNGKVVKDPDLRVQGAIELVFKKFREAHSIRQTLFWFRNEGIEFPVNKRKNNKIQIVWQLPKKSFFDYLLKNPFYAGAYTWGRKPTESVVVNGKVKRHQGKSLESEDCKVFIKNHHEGYIDWETYMENRKIIKNNYAQHLSKKESTGPARNGKSLLSGILRCGRCGRKLTIQYYGKSGTDGQYRCNGHSEHGETKCMRFGGITVDRRISEELLNVLSPLGIKASIEAIENLKEESDEKYNAHKKHLQQVEYEAQKAFEQYNEVDPRNRLVAAELEKRWNDKLDEVARIKKRISEFEEEVKMPTNEEQEKILQLGEQFQLAWEHENCPPALKKKILRTVIDEIIVNCDDGRGMLNFVIHWVGGCHTQFEIEKPRSADKIHKTNLDDIEIIKKMAIRYDDKTISMVLNKLDRTTGKGNKWNKFRVEYVRKKYSIPCQKKSKKESAIMTLNEAASYCKVSRTTIIRLVESGVLKNNQIAPYAPWEIQQKDLDEDPVSSILKRLKSTGKLDIEGDVLSGQQELFNNK